MKKEKRNIARETHLVLAVYIRIPGWISRKKDKNPDADSTDQAMWPRKKERLGVLLGGVVSSVRNWHGKHTDTRIGSSLLMSDIGKVAGIEMKEWESDVVEWGGIGLLPIENIDLARDFLDASAQDFWEIADDLMKLKLPGESKSSLEEQQKPADHDIRGKHQYEIGFGFGERDT